MAVLILLATQLVIVAAVHSKQMPTALVAPSGLRGSAPAAASNAVAPAPALERGHFYYSDSCDDCVFKAAQCGCTPAVEYFACLTKQCYSANRTRFTNKCSDLATRCSSELDIDCHGPKTVCKSKFNQLPSGGIGLTLDLEGVEDDAFCGPFGKCIGKIHMKAIIHNAPTTLALAPVFVAGPVPAPAPALATAPAPAPSPAAPAPMASSQAAVMLECGLPNVTNASIDNPANWILCRAPVVDNKAACDLPMFPTLAASKGKKAYCVLIEGANANFPKRLTQPAWHSISNVHEKTLEKKPALEVDSWFGRIANTVGMSGLSGSTIPYMSLVASHAA